MQFLDHDELNVARQLMFHYGIEGGYPPGDFNFRLIQALEKADSLNLETLLSAFRAFRRPVQILREYGGDSLKQLVDASHTHLYGIQR